MNESVEMLVLSTGFLGTALETTFFKPPGPGPFPLAVINHGKAFGNPRFDPRARFTNISREFLKRGYLVALPMRPGFSKSTGGSIYTGCNIESGGRVQGKAIASALAKLLERPEVDKSRVLLIGQSYGGIASVALGATQPDWIKDVINFAGGIKNESCTWERDLVSAFAKYGKESRLPTLWFYGDNDSYWGAELPRKMHEVYTQGGGSARLVAYGHFPHGDAHSMVTYASAVGIWLPETLRFLTEIDLPTDVVFDIEVMPRPDKTNFADILKVEAVPYLDERRREGYKKFLDLPLPRAFAIAKTGNIGWSSGGSDPLIQAIKNCENVAKTTCHLYAVDDDVVWSPSASQ